MVASTFKVSKGIAPDHLDFAVRLFWDAFFDKLCFALGPEDKAISFLTSAVDPEYAISAVGADGGLLGVAGFKSEAGVFVGGSLAQICDVYGYVGGVWRAAVLSLLERPHRSGTLLMDGIFVSENARGQGVGSALLTAIKREAQSLGCQKVRLDVIDRNVRAKKLYERHGFVETSTTDMGPLRHLFGFRRVDTMICDVS